MTLIRTDHRADAAPSSAVAVNQLAPIRYHDAPPLEQTIRAWHSAGHSQRAIARALNIDRRKVKRAIDIAA
jgi:hypothetical protein